MRIAGLVGLFSGRPHHDVGPDGRMALSDHFREFRARLLRCLMVFVLALGVALFFRHFLIDLVYGPYEQAQAKLPEGTTNATTSGAGAGLLLWLTLCGFAAAIVTAPYWLYQIWAFVLPGLYAQERKMSRIFVAVAGPLFLAGIALGYLTLPVALEVLIGFNPEGVTNLIDFNDYLQFFTRTLFVFGLAFNIPVFVVLLNFAGVVKGASLKAYRPWIIIGTFVFAAVATPSADPFTMTLMAGPMVILFFASEAIARFNDRRRARRAPNSGLSPDELSAI
ncbi:twin-arginine translocase subunit TatC [Nocardioides sp. zg-1308]|uniref:Sec-independent protein translocase protein TatC n=1 Tax=Nocardioides renjunii TaxID=3095075 RepID=A0ABU5KAV7_9ACTN|nr:MULTISPECIES: twin-arginine translocase subunit TatC [unclassified Nocardioides]MDZ5662071.1 twin-arginine translocase subunit TatC [Nocardioides sp. S-58]NPD06221.1 twin-arginine translocase subunit TatC [Nocardioides sp. zg-1308]WQQ24310.1 twin-arginine translocase subunit TatC [Nocardioides sp. S-34]